MEKLLKLSMFLTLVTMALWVVATNSLACGMISGRVVYEGDQVGSIYVVAVRIPPLPEQIYFETVICSPGDYQITGLPDGMYFVGAFLDVNNNGGPNPGEPMGICQRFAVILDAGECPNVNMKLYDLPAGSGSISGKIIYHGTQSGTVKVLAVGLTFTPFNYDMVDLTRDSGYTITSLLSGQYVVTAFLDADGNGFPDLQEPIGAVKRFIPVSDGENTPGVDILLTDPSSFTGSISGKISYSGTQTGPVVVTALGVTRTPYKSSLANPLDSTYTIGGLAWGEYWVGAFMDVDGDNRPSPGEPMGSYQNLAKVSDGKNTPNINITLSDPPTGRGGLSGTISYDGELTGEVIVQAVGFSNTPFARTSVPGPGNYTLTGMTKGLYFVMAYMDVDGDQSYDLGEPFALYEQNPTIVIEGITRPGINMTLVDLATVRSSISGQVIYNGTKTGVIRAYAFGLSLTPFKKVWVGNPGPYTLPELAMGVYLILAYMDVNENMMYDIGEPVGFYPGIVTVTGLAEVKNIDVELFDEGTGSISGTVTYTGDLTGTIYVGTIGLTKTPLAKTALAGPGPYTVGGLREGNYWAWAFLDVNGDLYPNPGEPFAITSKSVSVADGVDTPNINLVLGTGVQTEVSHPLAEAGLPDEFRLSQNYPNPFNSETRIRYQLPRSGQVSLRVFNMLGKEIKTLIDGQQEVGFHDVAWDGKDALGRDVASGIYIYRFETEGFGDSKKLLLLR